MCVCSSVLVKEVGLLPPKADVDGVVCGKRD